VVVVVVVIIIIIILFFPAFPLLFLSYALFFPPCRPFSLNPGRGVLSIKRYPPGPGRFRGVRQFPANLKKSEHFLTPL